MYYQLVDFGLEFPAIFDLPLFPSLATCSEETQEAGSEIIDEIIFGLFISLELFNKRDYLQRICDFLVEENEK